MDAGVALGMAAEVWVRYVDNNNGYRISCKGHFDTGARGPSKSKERFALHQPRPWVAPDFGAPLMFTSLLPSIAVRAPLANLGYAEDSQIELAKVVNGVSTILATGTFATDGTAAVKVKIYDDSGSDRFKVPALDSRRSAKRARRFGGKAAIHASIVLRRVRPFLKECSLCRA